MSPLADPLLKSAVVRAREKLYPPIDPFIADPVGWATKKLRAHVWSKQREIMESVRDNRFTAVPSCHGPGKSWTASSIAAWWIDVHPPMSSFVVTTAPTDPQVKAILWREISRRHREAGLIGRITLEAKWYAGERMVDEELIGFGRKPQDYDADAFQGIHAKYVLVLVDEACGVPKLLMDALETLMTNEYARMLAIGNPDDPTSHFETICKPGSGWNVIPISAFETPNFTGEYVPPSLAEDLVTKLWVEERKQKWGVASPLYQSKVLARFPEITNDTLITPNMIRRAQETQIPGTQLGTYGWDIARFGTDETVGYRDRGGRIRRVFGKHQQSTDVTADVIHMHLNQHGANHVPAVVDVVGVGGGVVDELHRRGLSVVPFNGGEPANDSQRFANRRAECYWAFREMFEDGLIDLDPNDETLAAQLVSIKWSVTRRGQVLIESKDEMRRRGLPSPDRADAAMMACTALSNVKSGVQQIILPGQTSDLLTRVM